MDNGVAITLLRHGVTKDNLAKRYLGWSDSPITIEARTELETLQSKLAIYDFYVSSDLLRCQQTANIIVPDTPGWTTANFREMHFGNWELKTYAELCHNTKYRDWIDNPFNNQPPNGETFPAFRNRIMTGWTRLREQMKKRHSKHVLIVTHGGVIRLLLTKLTNEPRTFWDWQVPHGHGLELTWNRQAWEEGLTCTSLQAVPTTGKIGG